MASSISEMNSLLKQYKIKEEDVNREVTNIHIDKISRSHCEKWKSLPAYLEMEGIVASDIEKKPIEEEEKRNNFFSKWKEEKGSEATYKALIGALLEMKCKKDAESVCEMITSNGTTDGDGVSCSQLDPKVHEDLQFTLEKKNRDIRERYATFVYSLCVSVKATGVSVEDFRTFLVKLPAFANDQQEKLLSGATAEIKEANTINEIFDLIDEKYASFLNYDIFRSIQNTFCRGLDSEDLNYSKHLKVYVNEHKISELCSVDSQLAKLNDTDEKLRFKFDFEMVTSKVAKVLDLKKRIADTLGVTPSTLRLFSVEEGCLIVTFLTTAFVADAILPADGELTTKQMEDFRAISVLWVECGGHRVEISSAFKQFVQDVNATNEAVVAVTKFWEEILGSIKDEDIVPNLTECKENLEDLEKFGNAVLYSARNFFIHADIHQDRVDEIKESYAKNDLDPFMKYIDKLEDLLAECKESQGKFSEVLSRCKSKQEEMKERCKEKEIANRNKKYIAFALGGVALLATGGLGLIALGANIAAAAAAAGSTAAVTAANVTAVAAGSGAMTVGALYFSGIFKTAEQKSKQAGEDLMVLQNGTNKLGKHIAEVKHHLLPPTTQARQVTMYMTKHDHEMFCHNFDILLKQIGKARHDLPSKPLPSY